MTDVDIVWGASSLTAGDLAPFFVGWPSPPSPGERLAILRAADEVVIARHPTHGVVGFATAITDGRFAASIPLVEVLPGHQGSQIGTHLVQAMLDRLARCYMIDLVCDDDVAPFYERLGGTSLRAMSWRNHDRLGP